jgi:hypothetical protein
MLDEHTIEIIYHDNITIDLTGIQKAWTKLDDFTQKKRLKKLTIVGKNTAITRDARRNGHAESEARKHIIAAEALVVHTLPQKMVANFYSKFIKDLYPIKYFTDIEDAKKWLSTIQYS